TALFNSDSGRKSLDKIDVRLLHLVEELARVSRERLDIFALALGVNRVEGKRRFPRTAQASDDHQFVARDFEREVLEVVLTRSANFDKFLRHDCEFCHTGNPQI